jgi:S-DNA-T family DNA segregation ATPase FtsK/SpoIIIE
LTTERLHFLAARPTRADGTDVVEQVRSAWRGRPEPILRLLPASITGSDLLPTVPAADRAGSCLLVGVSEKAVAPVWLDPQRDPHWLVLGDSGAGTTSALRCYAHEVARTRRPTRAQLVLVDPRRTLTGEVPDAYLLDHLTSAAQAAERVAELASYLELRLLERWTGAEVFVVVDDLALVSGRESPLPALLPLLPRAPDVGLHLAVALRAAGPGADYDPVLQVLRDLGTPTLHLSRSPPGRGRLVTRGAGSQTIQVAWHEPSH